jgi:Na+-transporting NADH:ubiquinone oxidoreductase subunit F
MQKQSSKLLKVVELNEDTLHFDFSFDPYIEFKAGQFFMLEVNNGNEKSVNRAYSIASPPINHESFSFCVKILPDGLGSQFLANLEPGDEVKIMGPYGHFVLREADKDIVMIATGTGLAPFMSMLPILFKEGFKRPITLFFGVRYEHDLFYVDQLRKWETEHDNFTAVITLSRPDDSWEGESGRVTAHLAEFPVENCKIYICGNGAMVKQVKAEMLERGVEKGDIHLEQFTPA